jgi:hypothetical protein
MFSNATSRVECILGDRYLPYIDQVKPGAAQLNFAVISRDPTSGDQFKARFPKNTRILVIDPGEIRMPLHHLPADMKKAHEYLAFENIFVLIIDDDEMLMIPPIADSSISALNTRNKGAIFFTKMLGQSHWGNIFEPEKSGGTIHSLIHGIHGKHTNR